MHDLKDIRVDNCANDKSELYHIEIQDFSFEVTPLKLFVQKQLYVIDHFEIFVMIT